MRRLIGLNSALILLLCMAFRAHADDTSAPEGTWYVSSDGQRLELVVEHHGANDWGGRILGENGVVTEIVNHLEWYPNTRRVVFRTSTTGGLWRWYRGHIVEGVLKGRASNARTSPLQPAVIEFTSHLTGWNASHIDQQLTPRTFDLLIDGEHLARLRIDRSAPASEQYVGQMKIYASQSQGALDEALQYDIHISHWDGTLLQFHRGTTDDWQAFSGTVEGRTISGQYFQSGTPLARPWQGTRAEVLGRGVGHSVTTSELATWQARLRQQLALLTMARAPMASSMNVNVLQADLDPLPSVTMHPRRDDNPDQWPRIYRLDELEFEFELPNPYGIGSLTRRAHGYLSRPGSSHDGKRPAVLVLNGHGGSAHAMMNPDHLEYWYGDAFARRGYIVLALDVSHRDHGDDPDNGNVAHPPIAADGFSTDWEEDGERAWTAMRAIDYLLTLPDVDPDQIVVAGLSMGGEVASIVGAMDTRVWATVASGYSPDLNVIRHYHNHPCWQWHWADLTEYVEMSDYQALVAPPAAGPDRRHRYGVLGAPAAFRVRQAGGAPIHAGIRKPVRTVHSSSARPWPCFPGGRYRCRRRGRAGPWRPDHFKPDHPLGSDLADRRSNHGAGIDPVRAARLAGRNDGVHFSQRLRARVTLNSHPSATATAVRSEPAAAQHPGLQARQALLPAVRKAGDHAPAKAEQRGRRIGNGLPLGNRGPGDAIRQTGQPLVVDVQQGIEAIPERHGRIGQQMRANGVERAIAVRGELGPPIVQRLLVDVVLAALPWRRGGKQDHPAGMRDQVGDELVGMVLADVLGHFQRLHQIEAPPQIQRSRQVGGVEALGRNQQPLPLHVIAVGTLDDLDAAFAPGRQPRARCAADIENAVQRQRLTQQAGHLHRRVTRGAGRVVHEMLVVNVTHDPMLLIQRVQTNRPSAIRPMPAHFIGVMCSPSTIAASRIAATYCNETTICATCSWKYFSAQA